jgi:uncharacterized protein YcbK (DUF882 family)
VFKYFNRKEFACKCGCGENHISDSFIELLDAAREHAGIPFKISSGYRCENHNRNEDGKANSSHTLLDGNGETHACDIIAEGSRARSLIVESLYAVGGDRIGISKEGGFIHFDTDDTKDKNVLWLY